MDIFLKRIYPTRKRIAPASSGMLEYFQLGRYKTVMKILKKKHGNKKSEVQYDKF